LGRWLDALNSRVREHAGRDARNLQIGHSYLLDKGHPIDQLSRLAQVLQDDIVPLLQEYTYEDYIALSRILGISLVDVQHLRIHDEMFDPARAGDFIQCLLELNPELATAPETVDAEAAAESEGDLDAIDDSNDGADLAPTVSK
jgi:5-methylcytosine-specific restriction protein B